VLKSSSFSKVGPQSGIECEVETIVATEDAPSQQAN
jgi:hypothetical protein